MYKRVRPARMIVSLAMTLGVGLVALPSWAGFRQPKNLERPYNRQAAATRSGGGCGYKEKVLLTALVPLGSVGLTAAARPTFHWYMPENTFQATEFVLYKVTELSPIQEQEILRVRFPVNQRAGVVGFQLPDHRLVPPLEVGQDYHWQALLICDPDDPSENQVANGWVKRTALSPQLKTQLARATPTAKFDRLAEEGLWYDALQQLDMMRSQETHACQVKEMWQEMMASVDVQLEHIQYVPLAQR